MPPKTSSLLVSLKHCSRYWTYLERLDIRNDVLKDIEVHEKNLVHWSQHPEIDTEALQAALQRILRAAG